MNERQEAVLLRRQPAAGPGSGRQLLQPRSRTSRLPESREEARLPEDPAQGGDRGRSRQAAAGEPRARSPPAVRPTPPPPPSAYLTRSPGEPPSAGRRRRRRRSRRPPARGRERGRTPAARATAIETGAPRRTAGGRDEGRGGDDRGPGGERPRRARVARSAAGARGTGARGRKPERRAAEPRRRAEGGLVTLPEHPRRVSERFPRGHRPAGRGGGEGGRAADPHRRARPQLRASSRGRSAWRWISSGRTWTGALRTTASS